MAQCSEFWSTIYYESDGIPTRGSTACSCTAMLSSAEDDYRIEVTSYYTAKGTLESWTGVSLALPASYSVSKDCCVKCGVTATGVRILFWPVETSAKNATGNRTPLTTTPYGFISDDFTLLVRTLDLYTAG